MRSKSPTNKMLCKGGCGLKIPKHGEPTCGAPACVREFLKSDEIDRALKAAKRARLRRERAEQKAERAKLKERKNKITPLAKKLNLFQTHVNKFIRKRDLAEWGTCVTCNTTLAEYKIDAGHLISRGKRGKSTAVRFDLFNIHAQCKKCNRFGFEQYDYIRGLEDRYGFGVCIPLFRYYEEMERQGFKPDEEWLEVNKRFLKQTKGECKCKTCCKN